MHGSFHTGTCRIDRPRCFPNGSRKLWLKSRASLTKRRLKWTSEPEHVGGHTPKHSAWQTCVACMLPRPNMRTCHFNSCRYRCGILGRERPSDILFAFKSKDAACLRPTLAFAEIIPDCSQVLCDLLELCFQATSKSANELVGYKGRGTQTPELKFNFAMRCNYSTVSSLASGIR